MLTVSLTAYLHRSNMKKQKQSSNLGLKIKNQTSKSWFSSPQWEILAASLSPPSNQHSGAPESTAVFIVESTNCPVINRTSASWTKAEEERSFLCCCHYYSYYNININIISVLCIKQAHIRIIHSYEYFFVYTRHAWIPGTRQGKWLLICPRRHRTCSIPTWIECSPVDLSLYNPKHTNQK